jgi:hypothetical protein
MSPGQPITILLGTPPRPFALRWTKRAEALNSSLARPQPFSAINKPKRRLGALTTILWCALVERDHGFEEPADLAEFLTTADQQVAAIKAVGLMIADAFPEKKSPPSADTSVSGPGQSSNADLVPPGSTGGT